MTQQIRSSSAPAIRDRALGREPSRREFVKSLAWSAAASGLTLTSFPAPSLRASSFAAPRPAAQKRKRIALLATEVRKFSHAQHFIDRFLEGYGWHGRHHYPPMDLVSLPRSRVGQRSSRLRSRARRWLAFDGDCFKRGGRGCQRSVADGEGYNHLDADFSSACAEGELLASSATFGHVG